MAFSWKTIPHLINTVELVACSYFLANLCSLHSTLTTQWQAFPSFSFLFSRSMYFHVHIISVLAAVTLHQKPWGKSATSKNFPSSSSSSSYPEQCKPVHTNNNDKEDWSCLPLPHPTNPPGSRCMAVSQTPMNIPKGHSDNFIKKTQSVLRFFLAQNSVMKTKTWLLQTQNRIFSCGCWWMKMGHQLHAQQADTSWGNTAATRTLALLHLPPSPVTPPPPPHACLTSSMLALTTMQQCDERNEARSLPPSLYLCHPANQWDPSQRTAHKQGTNAKRHTHRNTVTHTHI